MILCDLLLQLVFKNFTLKRFIKALKATKDRKIFVEFDKVRDWAFDENKLPRDHRFYWWTLNFGGFVMIFCDCPQFRHEEPTKKEMEELLMWKGMNK